MNAEPHVHIPESSEWFDLWHTHADWKGVGNESIERREPFLLKLFETWPILEAVAAKHNRPWQSWIVICVADSGQDAVYLHTPNPNHDNFPYTFDGVTWGERPPAWLSPFVRGPSVEFGTSYYNDVLLHWVRRTDR